MLAEVTADPWRCGRGTATAGRDGRAEQALVADPALVEGASGMPGGESRGQSALRHEWRFVTGCPKVHQ